MSIKLHSHTWTLEKIGKITKLLPFFFSHAECSATSSKTKKANSQTKLMLWLYYDFVVCDVWGGTNLNALQRCDGTVNESST